MPKEDSSSGRLCTVLCGGLAARGKRGGKARRRATARQPPANGTRSENEKCTGVYPNPYLHCSWRAERFRLLFSDERRRRPFHFSLFGCVAVSFPMLDR